MTDEQLNKTIERSVMEHHEMTDELKKAKQQLAEANRRTEDATKQIEALRIREEGIRIQAERRSRKIEYQLLTSLARAEKAEKQVQEAVESAARLEQKFMDVMKRIEGNTGMRQRLIVVLADTYPDRMETDADARRIPEELSQEANEKLLATIARAEKAEKQAQKAVESTAQLEQKFEDVMKQMKGTTGMRQRLNVVLADTYLDRTDMDDAERYVSNKDEVLDHEAVENMLRHSVENAASYVEGENFEGNGSDDDMNVKSNEGVIAVQKGKQKMV